MPTINSIGPKFMDTFDYTNVRGESVKTLQRAFTEIGDFMAKSTPENARLKLSSYDMFEGQRIQLELCKKDANNVTKPVSDFMMYTKDYLKFLADKTNGVKDPLKGFIENFSKLIA